MNKNAVAEMGQQYQVAAAEKLVPEGYKQTEVGVIPEDWGVITIGEALSEKYLLDQMDGNHGELYPKSHEFTFDGVPYIGATDFGQGQIDYKGCKYLPVSRAAKFKKGIAKNGDVLFAHNATVGPVAIVDTGLDYVILSTTATYYRCNPERLNNKYLAGFFESDYFKKQYTSVMSQSTRNQVPILAQRKFFIVIPSIEEQLIIANTLSDTDALLSELEKLIAKKQAIKTATMQQLLTGRTRLPQFAHHPDGSKKGYKQSELGEIPEDWEVVSLGEFLVNGQLGGNYSNSEIESEYPLIKMGNLNRGRIKLDKIEYSAIKPEEKDRLFYGDVLLNTRNTLELVGKVAIWRDEITKAYFNSNLMRLNFNKHLIGSGFFVNLLMNTDRFLNGLSGIAIGTTSVAAIYLRDLLTLKVVLPSKQEQTAIATILSDMDEEIQALEQRLNKTRQIKQGMMQELLTGKTRLVVPQD